MSSTTKPKESNEPRKSDKAEKSEEPELPLYKYTPLTTPDALRILRLRPASDTHEDVDCEIIEVPFEREADVDENFDNTFDIQKGKRSENSNFAKHPQFEDREGNIDVLTDIDSSDDEGNRLPRSHGNAESEHTNRNVDFDENHNLHKRRHTYEAVSWCWGREPADQILRVHKDDNVFALYIPPNLKRALWALRKNNEVRQLWIDAICIEQRNTRERNQQVPRMDTIYGGAESVCIWLGDADENSKLAMKFIKDRVLQFWDFDELIENRKMAQNWAALIRLMKRPWFSRRWVVQEIALSPRGGTIYCGKDQNSWQDFADAVSLFVEVESATHRLSDVMKLDQSFGNIPDFFGDVSSLGAALLVDATSNLFRNAMTGERKPLSSLEYLVSRLSVFEASQPRDTIYALLAISKDTTPKNISDDPNSPEHSQKEKNAMTFAPKKGFTNQNYNVDYKLPVIDVFQEFIQFSIRNSDPTRALDIICRPWAPTIMKSHDDPDFMKPRDEKVSQNLKKKDQEIPLPSWIPGLSGAAFEMEEHPTAGLRMERQNADPLVGLPEDSGHKIYSAAGDRKVDLAKVRFIKWKTLKNRGASYPEHSMFVPGFILDEVSTVEQLASNGNIPYKWLKAGNWTDTDKSPPEAFWRTLVADRGHGGRNPPTYFPRACKESMRFKAKTMSKTGGNLDCKKLINEGRCTIVAEFLRRVQEVIWNRQLMKTKQNRLGLVRDDVSPGFKVCILYGCSVPVILQEVQKSDRELKAEQYDRYKQWRREVDKLVACCKARYKMRKLRKLRNLPKAEPYLSNEAGPSDQIEAENENGKQSMDAQSTIEYGGSSDSKVDTQGEIQDQQDQDSQNAQGSQQDEDMQEDRSVQAYEDARKDENAQQDGSTQEDTKVRKLFRSKTMEEKMGEIAEGKKNFNARKARERAREVPCLTYYRLVGECYVHGMMNGEAITFQNRMRIPEQLFEMR